MPNSSSPEADPYFRHLSTGALGELVADQGACNEVEVDIRQPVSVQLEADERDKILTEYEKIARNRCSDCPVRRECEEWGVRQWSVETRTTPPLVRRSIRGGYLFLETVRKNVNKASNTDGLGLQDKDVLMSYRRRKRGAWV